MENKETTRLLKEIAANQRELAQLFAVLIKRNVMQSTLIGEMNSVGIGPTRIAELLGTTKNTVSVSLSSKKKKLSAKSN